LQFSLQAASPEPFGYTLVLNKQPLTAGRGWPFGLELGRWIITNLRKKKKKRASYEMLHRVKKLDGFVGAV